MIANPRRAKREAARLSRKEDKRDVYSWLDEYAAEEGSTLDDFDRAVILRPFLTASSLPADDGELAELVRQAVAARLRDRNAQ
jgi:hypothetical protein